MRKLTIIVFLFICQISFGQSPNTLIGHWYHTWEQPRTPNTDKGTYYQKDTVDSKGSYKFGRNLYFNQDGTFTDKYVAPCGNDGGIHQYDGMWKLVDNNYIEIYDLKEKYNKANSYPTKKAFMMVVIEKGLFKIQIENKSLLRLQIIRNYETFMEKNSE